MAETSYRIPVYRGWPERPYKVLGSIRFEDPNKYWDDGIISKAARVGKRKGGNAIIIRQGSEFGVGQIVGMKNDPSQFSYNQTTALVIRWLSEREISEAVEQNKDFLAKFTAQHPDLTVSQNVSELAIRYLLQSGISIYSDDMLERFSQVMRRISTVPSGDSISGEWLFKGTLSRSSIVSSDQGEGMLGMATVKMEGENVAIISSEGNTELNFNGTYTQGRLSGQLGIAGFNTKCEGAALSDKISFSFQSLTSDGVVHGTVVLQRIKAKLNPNQNDKAKPSTNADSRRDTSGPAAQI